MRTRMTLIKENDMELYFHFVFIINCLKMCRNKFFEFFIWFIINCLSLASTSLWARDFNSARQLQSDITEEKNETSFNKNLLENFTASSTERDNLFWTISDMNVTTKQNMSLQMINLDTEPEDTDYKNRTSDKKEEEISASSPVQENNVVGTTPNEDSEIDEKVNLQRKNCHLKLAVQDTRDLKIQIKFDQLQNGTSGKCCITLNGPKNSSLAILISNIRLYRNGSDGEVLKVIIENQGSAFVLKEYRYGNDYQPLILTETHKVYLVLDYNVTVVFLNEEEGTHFNLNVLTYHKHENFIQASMEGNFATFSRIKDQNWNKF